MMARPMSVEWRELERGYSGSAGRDVSIAGKLAEWAGASQTKMTQGAAIGNGSAAIPGPPSLRCSRQGRLGLRGASPRVLEPLV